MTPPRLETVTDPGQWTDNVTILFVDDASVQSVVAIATSGSISNMPYAPDEDFSFRAELFDEAGQLYVSVVQTMSTVLSSTESVRCFRSGDGGRTWERIPALPDFNPIGQCLSRVSSS